MKEELKSISRYKFRTWKRTFTVFFSVFMVSFVLGAIIFSYSYKSPLTPYLARLVAVFGLRFSEIFKTLLVSLVPFFILFVFGPTIYAPFTSALTIIIAGMISGSECSYLFGKERYALALFEIIFSSAVNYLLIIYATMITLTALRIFTDKKKDSSHEIFEGSLFCASGFRGIFNYRYVLTYIGFYVFISLIATGVTLVRAFTVILV